MLVLSRFVAQNCLGNPDRTGKDRLFIGEGLTVTLLAADGQNATVLVEGVQSEGGYIVKFLNSEEQTMIVEGVSMGLGNGRVNNGASITIDAPESVRVLRGELLAA
jgi:sRNA-binding carbon storage regulator CsrA